MIDVDAYDNTRMISISAPCSIETSLEAVKNQPEDTILRTVRHRSMESGVIREVPEVTTIYTDYHAPVERSIDRIVLDETAGSSAP